MLKFINVPVFLLSLLVGLVFVYFSSAPTRIIHVYPTPDNANQVQYKDQADICHHFLPKQVACPSDKNKIHNISMQK